MPSHPENSCHLDRGTSPKGSAMIALRQSHPGPESSKVGYYGPSRKTPTTWHQGKPKGSKSHPHAPSKTCDFQAAGHQGKNQFVVAIRPSPTRHDRPQGPGRNRSQDLPCCATFPLDTFSLINPLQSHRVVIDQLIAVTATD